MELKNSQIHPSPKGKGLLWQEDKIIGPSKSEELKWQAENDLRTLRQAEEIKANSARLKRAQTMAKNELNAITRVINKK